MLLLGVGLEACPSQEIGIMRLNLGEILTKLSDTSEIMDYLHNFFIAYIYDLL